MSLKKLKFFSCFVIILLCFLSHFMYEWIPNNLIAIFFPVNESIWEHMKILYTSILLGGIFDYILLNKFNIKYNNFFLSLFSSAFLSIPIYLIIFYPLFYRFGNKMYIAISVMILVVILSQIISYYILKSKNNIKILNIISFVMIIIMYIIFGILTFYPSKNIIFFDTIEEKYGIDIYR